MILGEMTHADTIMNPRFESDPADIVIWSNPDSNPCSDLALVEYALSERSCY